MGRSVELRVTYPTVTRMRLITTSTCSGAAYESFCSRKSDRRTRRLAEEIDHLATLSGMDRTAVYRQGMYRFAENGIREGHPIDLLRHGMLNLNPSAPMSIL